MERSTSRSELLHSFPPIVGDGARMLILGNMPSVQSLAAGRYYASPRNAFWRIMAEVYGFDADAKYDERVAAMVAHGVAVWDVLRCCRRVGSLDSAVERDSMVANDFETLFANYPTIASIVFNGAAAEQNFARLVQLGRPLPSQRAPSTSPAQTMAYQDKLHAWRTRLNVRR